MPIRAAAKGRVDWSLVFFIIGIVTMGTVAIFSAASPLPFYGQVMQRHFLAMGLGALLFVFGSGFNYQIFQDQAKMVYGLALGLLLAVLLFGSTQRGHKAWFHLPFINFQPAELARTATILVLAAFLDFRSRKMGLFSTVWLTGALAAPSMILILKQPDFSTTLTFLPIVLGMLFCGGAAVSLLGAVVGLGATALFTPMFYIYCQIRYPYSEPGSWPHFILQTSHLGLAALIVVVTVVLLCLAAWRLAILLRLRARAGSYLAVAAILCAGFLSGAMAYKQLKSYQRNRVVAFLAPQTDIQGAAYHVHQSQIAIGSGGIFGKGLFSGTQSQLGFLPERHTDFIYAVMGEEMGVLGTMTVLMLYLGLIWRLIVIGRQARDHYGYLICCGLASMFAFQLALNVGMCLGLLPVAGIPLPLVSYGGSSLVITLWSLGIAANI